jgi:hypothetical protein
VTGLVDRAAPANPGRVRPRRRFGDALLALGAAALPVLLSDLVVHLCAHRGFGGYVPVFSDEVAYWHQISSFGHVGFGNGYYTYQERLAPALTPYGAWGPMLPMLYGGAFRLTGGGLTGVVRLNLLVVVLAIAATLLMARPTRPRLLLVAAALGSCGPLLYYLSTGMSEPLHYALAVLLAGLFHRLLHAAPGERGRPAAVLVAVVVLAALLRSPWAILLVPAGLITFQGHRRRLAVAVVLAGGAMAALGALFVAWSAPFPYFDRYRIRTATGLGEKLGLIGHNVTVNLRHLVAVSDPYGDPFGALQRWQALTVIGIAVLLAGRAWRRRDRATALAGVTAVLAVAAPIVLAVTLYDLRSGVRTIAPHVMFAAVLGALALRPRWNVALPAVLVASNLAALAVLHPSFAARVRFDYTRTTPAAVAAFRAELGGHLRYRPDAGRWCNTLLISAGSPFFAELTAVPPGIGLSVDIDHRFDGPLRSGYVLVADDVRPLLPDRGERLVPLAHTAHGTLYRNPVDGC